MKYWLKWKIIKSSTMLESPSYTNTFQLAQILSWRVLHGNILLINFLFVYDQVEQKALHESFTRRCIKNKTINLIQLVWPLVSTKATLVTIKKRELCVNKLVVISNTKIRSHSDFSLVFHHLFF